MMKDGKFVEAMDKLNLCSNELEALGPLSKRPEDVQKFKQRKAAYLNNLALCYKQQNDSKNVIAYTSVVIEMESDLEKDMVTKAYLRRGKYNF